MIVSKKRLEKLSDPNYREEYLKSTTTAWLVYQLKALRRKRGWTQADLAKHAGGLPQSAVGRLESENYGNWTTSTLLKLAKAFDVALEIRFVGWPEFVRRTSDTSTEQLAVNSFSANEFVVTPAMYRQLSPPDEVQIARVLPPSMPLASRYNQSVTSEARAQ